MTDRIIDFIFVFIARLKRKPYHVIYGMEWRNNMYSWYWIGKCYQCEPQDGWRSFFNITFSDSTSVIELMLCVIE